MLDKVAMGMVYYPHEDAKTSLRSKKPVGTFTTKKEGKNMTLTENQKSAVGIGVACAMSMGMVLVVGGAIAKDLEVFCVGLFVLAVGVIAASTSLSDL